MSTLKSLTQNPTSACKAGQFLGNDGCENCAADHYGAGGWLTSCTQCPSGKGVEAGEGTQESNCTWSKFLINYLCNSPLIHLLTIHYKLYEILINKPNTNTQ